MRNAFKSIGIIFFLISFCRITSFAECVYERVIQGENLAIGTMLSWSTAYEEGNSMFIVEKSSDGMKFEDIGNVTGSGNSDDLKNYHYLDVHTQSDRAYYRLKQIDFDGAYSYTDIVTVQQEYINNFMVARMSAVSTTDIFEVTLDVMKNGVLQYHLQDLKGNIILNDEMLVVDGLNDLSLDVTDQKAGIYKVVMTLDEEKETLVISKVADKIFQKPNVASNQKNNGNK